jgi:hypothetical protein
VISWRSIALRWTQILSHLMTPKRSDVPTDQEA